MSILNSKLYTDTITEIQNTFPEIISFKNKSILITGCNGLICSAVVDFFIASSLYEKLNMKIYLASRNAAETKKRFNLNDTDTHIETVAYDAEKKFTFSKKIDYIIHGASPASPDQIISQPVETMLCNITGLHNLLTLAEQNNARLLYISSSEVYGNLHSSQPIKEEDAGNLELLNPRSAYGMSKRAAETLCISYVDEYSADVVIVRPGHIYGPSAKKDDRRVSSAFMYDALEGKNLVLKSKGEQLRSYTNSLDCAKAILTVMIKGKKGNAYNISNPQSVISIAEMSTLVAEYCGVKLSFEIPDENEKKAFNPMMNSSLDSTKLESLGWKPFFTKQKGFEFTINTLKEIKRESL